MVKCHVCGSEKFHEELITEIFQIEGKFYLVEDIPATVCSHCGEESFSREITEHIRLILHGEPTFRRLTNNFWYASVFRRPKALADGDFRFWTLFLKGLRSIKLPPSSAHDSFARIL